MPARRPARVARAHAKINLTLRILGARPDGYRELRTTFQTLALHDTLTFHFEPGPLRLESTDPACPVDAANLVWRAAEGVWAAAGRRGEPEGVRIHLTKRIPMQSGLGGGSSDAAAALLVLAAAWRVPRPAARLPAIAASLGADVPFFLRGGTALGVGRGDVIYPLPDFPATWVTLVVPAFGVSTADAYRWWDHEHGGGTLERLRPRQHASARARRVRGVSERGWGPASVRNVGEGPLVSWLPERELTNDLQGPVTAHHPEIGRLVRALERAGADYAAMSGSGSAVFGLFRRRGAAEASARALEGAGRRVLTTRTLRRTRV